MSDATIGESAAVQSSHRLHNDDLAPARDFRQPELTRLDEEAQA